MKKVTVIPLGANFLERLAEEIFCQHFSPDDPLSLSQVTILMPHRRGVAYLRNYLFRRSRSQNEQPLLSPRIVAIGDFVEEEAVKLEEPPRHPLSAPDQAWVLFGIVKENGTYGRIAASWDRFFPWGIRLATLLEELDSELVIPRDIHYPEDVAQEARAFLEGLQGIYSAFDRQLMETGFTTKAKRLRLVAERVEEVRLAGVPIYLAGFYALTRAEEKIFRHLFAQGARIFWHANPEDLPPLYRRWKANWGLEIETRGEESPVSTRLHFHEAYDLHAELLRVKDILPAQVEQPDQCAVVLPDPSALIPVLHFLPSGVPVNVSLGYPLERTALFSLMEQLMRLQEGRDGEGSYYHRDYLTLIRHPYLRRLPTSAGKEGRIILHLLEEKVRHYGKPFLPERELVELVAISEDPERDSNFLAAEGLSLEEAKGFVRDLHRHLLTPWEDLHTPLDVAAALRRLVRLLFSPFLGQEDFVREHLLDNELIYTLEERVIRTLEDALFCQQPMGKRLLFSVLREVVSMARTPFEGHPLVGLQILGLLETRLLSFERVIVIDMNEGVVPAQEDVNPLMPEPLKKAIGLAGREREEAIVRYHVERLIHSSKEAHLIWQSSTTPTSSGLEGKKMRSRFVEGLLWKEEREKTTLRDECVNKVPLLISPESCLKGDGLIKKPSDQQSVQEFIRDRSRKGGLSASLLNTYLGCPLKFYYKYLLDLKPVLAVPEDMDSTSLGEIVHKCLQDYFTLYRKKTYRKKEDSDPERLMSIFRERFRGSVMYRCLPPDKRFFVEKAAAYRLENYLSGMPADTFVEALEEEYRLSLPLDLGDVSFSGKVDRIDRRQGCRIILDYKTGRVEGFTKGHFEKRLLTFSTPAEVDRDGLKVVRDAIKDLQLPLYVLLVTSGREAEVGKTLSAHVELGRRGEERYFLAAERLEGLRDAYISWFSRTFPALLTYVIAHMIEAPVYYPATQEETCRFCEYEGICRFSFS